MLSNPSQVLSNPMTDQAGQTWAFQLVIDPPPPASVYFAPIRLNYPTADEALNSVLGPGPVITMSGLVIISSVGDRAGRQCWSSRPPANRLINGRIFVLRLIITVYSPLWRWSGCQPAHRSLATPGLFHALWFFNAPFYFHADLWVFYAYQLHAYSYRHAQIHAFSVKGSRFVSMFS